MEVVRQLVDIHQPYTVALVADLAPHSMAVVVLACLMMKRHVVELDMPVEMDLNY
jgi:hypothetical protein